MQKPYIIILLKLLQLSGLKNVLRRENRLREDKRLFNLRLNMPPKFFNNLPPKFFNNLLAKFFNNMPPKLFSNYRPSRTK